MLVAKGEGGGGGRSDGLRTKPLAWLVLLSTQVLIVLVRRSPLLDEESIR